MLVDKLGFPRVNLTDLPTPFEEAPRFSKALGGPRIFLKRDDTTTLAMGGNKARKLELLMGEAVSLGSDHVITTGGPQSNHARMTAAAGRKLGMQPVLVLEGEDPCVRQGNLLLDHILGAEIIFSGARPPEEVMAEVKEDLEKRGKRPYLIPLGGSNALGALGYVSCVEEMNRQAEGAGVRPRAVYVATGSSGTLAGLVLGKILTGASFEVKGVAVSPGAAEKEGRAVELVLEAIQLIRSRLEDSPGPGALDPDHAAMLERIRDASLEKVRRHVAVIDGFVGPGYGIPTPECLEAITLLARNEGVLADPVYSGKALSALVADARTGKYARDDVVVFLHTGGVPADFAYSDVFVKGRI
ncbi:MAG TPA: D-cysteine desulfhydrase family protein [Firmicutes bacterium]|nr:D-cysteine desulfhydrase family protein [Candidatus Fermentithermobacillaceae bacterium]